QQQDESAMMASYVRQLRQFLIDALNNGVPGHLFAARLITQVGEGPYHMITAKGEPGVLMFLQQAPEVWGELIRTYGPERLQKFGGKIVAVSAVRADLQSMQHPPHPAAAAPGPIPVAQPPPGAVHRPPQPI